MSDQHIILLLSVFWAVAAWFAMLWVFRPEE